MKTRGGTASKHWIGIPPHILLQRKVYLHTADIANAVHDNPSQTASVVNHMPDFSARGITFHSVLLSQSP